MAIRESRQQFKPHLLIAKAPVTDGIPYIYIYIYSIYIHNYNIYIYIPCVFNSMSFTQLLATPSRCIRRQVASALSAQDFAGTDGGSAQGAVVRCCEVLGGLGFWVRASNQKKVPWWIGGLEVFLYFSTCWE